MRNVLKLEVAPAAEVRRDIKRNIPWLSWLFVVALLYIIGSSLLIRLWESDWSFLHSCYFTVINMTTVGFGDVYPLTQMGKVIAGINGAVGLVIFGCFVAILALAFQPSGWTTLLTPVYGSRDFENELVAEKANHTESGVPELLEGLAKTIRGTEPYRSDGLEHGRVRVHIYGGGNEKKVFTEIMIYIDIG